MGIAAAIFWGLVYALALIGAGVVVFVLAVMGGFFNDE